jgi:hypothetical protein
MASKGSKSGLPARAASDDLIQQDIATVKSDAAVITQFLSNLHRFFTEAKALEDHAAQRLDAARLMAQPTSKAEDESIQIFVRDCADVRKQIVGHWSIAQALHHIHRRFTARRGKAEQMIDDAVVRATRLHTEYVDAERRRIEEEERKRRREEEERARQARDRELADLEAQALKREAASPDLSDRERAFVDLMVGHDLSADVAAQRAGFKAEMAAGRLLSMKKITLAIKVAREAKAIRQQASATAAQPLDTKPLERVESQIGEAASDRSSWTGVVDSEAEFIDAVISGQYGIPRDLLTINQKRLNEEARSMKKLLDRWPGVHAHEKRSIV